MEGWGAEEGAEFDSYQDYADWYLSEYLGVRGDATFREIARKINSVILLCSYPSDCFGGQGTVVEIWVEEGRYHGDEINHLEEYQYLLDNNQR